MIKRDSTSRRPLLTWGEVQFLRRWAAGTLAIALVLMTAFVEADPALAIAGIAAVYASFVAILNIAAALPLRRRPAVQESEPLSLRSILVVQQPELIAA